MEKHSLTDEELQQAIGKFFESPQIGVANPLSMGVENSNYHIEVNGQDLVLRVYGFEHSHIGPRSENDLTYELTFMQAVHEAGVQVPLIHRTLEGELFSSVETVDGTRFVSVVDYVPGEAPRDFTGDMLGQVARAIATMHQIATGLEMPVQRNWIGDMHIKAQDRMDRYLKHPKRTQTDDSELFEGLLDVYEELRNKIDFGALPRGPIHGDVLYHNMVFEGSQLRGIFDFDDCRESYFVEDIVKTLFKYLDDPSISLIGEGRENYQAFIQAYESVRPLSDDERLAIQALFFSIVQYEVSRIFYEEWDGRPEPRFDRGVFLEKARAIGRELGFIDSE